MTTTSAPFREADVLRDTAGKFSEKGQSAPELTLGEHFDLAHFMQEPPAAAEPFSALQPVIYRGVDGSDLHASVVGVEENGYVRIVERTPGTFGDIDTAERLVEARYLTEDLDISRDSFLRQERGVTAATTVAEQIASATAHQRSGIDSYTESLQVRDQLKVDGRTDWATSFAQSTSALDSAIYDLERRDLITSTAASWMALDGDKSAPAAFDNANEAVGWDSSSFVSAALQAKLLEQYGDIAIIGDGHVERVNSSVAEAFDLGERMSQADHAADLVDADADAIGAEAASQIFPAYVAGLSQRKKTAYRKAVGAASEAFETLERYGLLNDSHSPWGRWSERPVNEEAILTRAAGQAAILRHYQPETGLTDAQLDAISTVWDGAVAAHAKAAA